MKLVVYVDVEAVEKGDYKVYFLDKYILIEHISENFRLKIGRNYVSMEILARRPGHDHDNMLFLAVENTLDNSYPDVSLHEEEKRPVTIKVRGHPAGWTKIKINEYGHVKILREAEEK